MSTQFNLDYGDILKLEEKIAKIPEQTENLLNEILHSFGAKSVKDDITSRLPVSNRNKKHAKTSNWSKVEKGNLEFVVKSKGGAANNKNSFGYLVFPNEGRGPSNPMEQRFMEKGLESSTPKVLDEINEQLDKIIKEALA